MFVKVSSSFSPLHGLCVRRVHALTSRLSLPLTRRSMMAVLRIEHGSWHLLFSCPSPFTSWVSLGDYVHVVSGEILVHLRRYLVCFPQAWVAAIARLLQRPQQLLSGACHVRERLLQWHGQSPLDVSRTSFGRTSRLPRGRRNSQVQGPWRLGGLKRPSFMSTRMTCLLFEGA